MKLDYFYALAAVAFSAASLSFFITPIKLFFSSAVWNRPCPNLDDVSINLREIFSKATRFFCLINDLRKVIGRFLVPQMHPFSIKKSCLTIPYCGKPPY